MLEVSALSIPPERDRHLNVAMVAAADMIVAVPGWLDTSNHWRQDDHNVQVGLRQKHAVDGHVGDQALTDISSCLGLYAVGR
jgi:hypothetical protein